MSMREPFHFRYMRELVGVFVLGSLAIGLGTLVLLGARQRLFERSVPVRSVFAAEKVTVIHPGVPVRLAGENVGRVEEVRVDKNQRAHVLMVVHLTARESLRADSAAILRVPIAGLVGDFSIELTPGGDAPPFRDDAELPGLTQGDPLGEIESVMHHLGGTLPALTEKATELLGHLNALAAQAEAGKAGTHASALLKETAAVATQIEEERVAARAAETLGELDHLLASVNRGEGSAGRFVRDPALHDRAVKLLDDLHTSWADLSKLLKSAGQISGDGAVITAELRKRAEDLPALVDQTERVLLRTNQTLEAMQRHWLLRGSVEDPLPAPEPPAVLDRAGATPTAERSHDIGELGFPCDRQRLDPGLRGCSSRSFGDSAGEAPFDERRRGPSNWRLGRRRSFLSRALASARARTTGRLWQSGVSIGDGAHSGRAATGGRSPTRRRCFDRCARRSWAALQLVLFWLSLVLAKTTLRVRPQLSIRSGRPSRRGASVATAGGGSRSCGTRSSRPGSRSSTSP